jgi:sugar lactone lactonase YvrE
VKTVSRARQIAALLVAGAVASTARADGLALRFRKALYLSGNPDDAAAVADDKTHVKLNAPEGVACGDDGTVAVADTGNHRLVLYRYADGIWSGGAEVKIPELPYPTRLQMDSKGNILALDRKTKKIVRLNAKGALVNVMEFKGLDGGGAVVPAGLALDRADNLYVLDVAGSRVVVADPLGAVTRQVALPAVNGLFTGLAVDSAGTIFALEGTEGAVWSAAASAAAFAPLGKAMKDYMNFGSFITANNKGTLVVVDQNGHGVVLLGTDGSYRGRQLAMGWSEGYVYYPTQLCLTSTGTAVVADRGNNRVQLFTAN